MSKKNFTLEEANRLLPEVKIELEALQGIKFNFESKFTELRHGKKHGMNEDQIFSLEGQIEFLQMEAKVHMHNLQLRGVELKDIDTGLVDFPSIINGKEVLLCWKLGESSIRFYHGVHEGFNGRKRIEN